MHIRKGQTATIREFRLNSDNFQWKRLTQGTAPLDADPPRKAAELLKNY